jgi:hypothetical protein
MIERVALVTDFGVSGPYVGQMKLRLSALVPRIPVIDLVSDLAPFRPDLAAYLLPALTRDMPVGTLYVCVVDPGVGSERAALVVEADGDWYVGPDNGLLAVVAGCIEFGRVLRVDWRPDRLSDSFHGRDLFAPVAAMLCDGSLPPCTEISASGMVGSDWPDELPRVVYVDPYGNLVTGIQATSMDLGSIIRADGRELSYARTFSETTAGTAFWYVNAFGLVELAVNQGNAQFALGLDCGDPVERLA